MPPTVWVSGNERYPTDSVDRRNLRAARARSGLIVNARRSSWRRGNKDNPIPTMIKYGLCIAAVAALWLSGPGTPARAQTPPIPAAPTGTAAALTAVQAQQALDVLQDPQQRDRLIAVLKAITAAASVVAPAPAAPAVEKPAPAVTLAPHSLGAELLVALTRWSTRLADDVAATAETMTNLPQLW